MKLKSILMIGVLVSIMAMAGIASAACVAGVGCTTTSATSTNGDSTFWFDPSYYATGAGGSWIYWNPADALPAGSGTGTTGGIGMPEQVAYNGLGNYTAGADAGAGFRLNQNLFGMCGGVVGVTFTENCVKFVPSPAAVSALVGIVNQDAGAEASQTEPANAAAFNQARFTTGLVSNVTDGSMSMGFSQKTAHYMVGDDGDFIDQRLATAFDNTNIVMNQTVIVGLGSGSGTYTDLGGDGVWAGVGSPTPDGLIPGYVGSSPDEHNSAMITQSVGTAESAGNGDYGQSFRNATSFVDPHVADVFNGPAATYVPALLPGSAPSGTLP